MKKTEEKKKENKWQPDPSEAQIAQSIIPEIKDKYYEFKEVIHPLIDNHIWYKLAYYNLSMFYHFTHSKNCLGKINWIEHAFSHGKIDGTTYFIDIDYSIYNFFLHLRSGLDTLASQMFIIFTAETNCIYLNIENCITKIKRKNSSNSRSTSSRLDDIYGEIIGDYLDSDNENGYTNFNKIRNHLDHDIFMIRYVDKGGTHLPDIDKLYGNSRSIDDQQLLILYRNQMIYDKRPSPSEYSQENVFTQCNRYYSEIIELFNGIYEHLKIDYDTELKPFIS